MSAGGNRKEGCGGNDLTLVEGARTAERADLAAMQSREGRAYGRCLRG